MANQSALYGYGETPEHDQLYGQAAQALSPKNQLQAVQLGLPSTQPGRPSQAGSQEAAQDSSANFQDIYNENRGYAKKEAEAARDKVVNTAEGKDSSGFDAPPSQQAAQPVTSQQASTAATQPPPQQGLSLNQLQRKSDMSALTGYGDAPSQPSGLTALHAPTTNVPTLGGGATATSQQGVNGNQDDRDRDDPEPPPAPPKAPTPPPADTPPADEPPATDNGHPQGSSGTPTPATYTADHNPSDDQAAADAKTAQDKAKADAEAKLAADQKLLAQTNGSGQADPSELAQLDQLTKANDLLKGYADDGGTDILQQVYGPEASQWDADIMNAGGGAKVFGELNKLYKGKDEEYAKGLADTINYRTQQNTNAQNQVNADQNALNGFGQMGGAASGAPVSTGSIGANGGGSQTSTGYGSYDEFMNSGQFGADVDWDTQLHQLGMTLSPADTALIELGKSGKYSGQAAAEYFRNAWGGEFDEGTLDNENIRLGFAEIAGNGGLAGQAQAKWLWDNLTPEDWASFKGHNYGYVSYMMKQILEARGPNFSILGGELAPGQHDQTPTGKSIGNSGAKNRHEN